MAGDQVNFNGPAKDVGPVIDSFDMKSSDAHSSASLMSLPQRWVLTKTTEGVLSSTLNISTMDGFILNAVTTRSGLRSDLIIHQGQSTDSAPLATARTRFISFKVFLPGLVRQSEDREIRVKTKWWGMTPQVMWQMNGRNGQQYDFEWVSRNGRWRLMRRGPQGEDCVANWTVSFSSSRLSGEFEFESAAVTEELGDAFPYVASISALVIGKLLRDTVFANVGAAVAS